MRKRHRAFHQKTPSRERRSGEYVPHARELVIYTCAINTQILCNARERKIVRDTEMCMHTQRACCASTTCISKYHSNRHTQHTPNAHIQKPHIIYLDKFCGMFVSIRVHRHKSKYTYVHYVRSSKTDACGMRTLSFCVSAAVCCV